MNIIRLYNQNRKQLFIVILIVSFIISVIHFSNYLVIKKHEGNLNSEISSSNKLNVTTTYNSQQSVISSSSVSNQIYKKQSKVINNFIKYCNEGNSAKAYDILSTDCKEVMFPTLEYFETNYLKQIFSESKLYTIKNWIDNTYKINITENILATGKGNNGIYIEDYFTIITENGTEKLNINGFIKRKKKSNKLSENSLEIQVVYEDIYMDYTTYTVKVKNKINKTILLDSGEGTKNIYLIDKNSVKHASYRNEVVNAELMVLPYAENTIQIKFSSRYSPSNEISGLVFADIVLDYDLYISTNNKKEYINRKQVLVEM